MKKRNLFSPVFVVAIAIVVSGFGFLSLSNNGGQALFGSVWPWGNSPKLSLQNLTDSSRNPNFWVGDRYRLTAVAKPNKPVKLCWAMRNRGELQSKGCNDVSQNQPIGSDGNWQYEETLVGISVGRWQRWIEINNIASNKVEQIVRRPKPAVTVISPNGGEKFTVGKTLTIKWKRNWMPDGASARVDIVFKKGNQVISFGGGSNIDDSSWKIKVPGAMLPGDDYKIVITSRGFGGDEFASLSDESDATFSIVVPLVK